MALIDIKLNFYTKTPLYAFVIKIKTEIPNTSTFDYKTFLNNIWKELNDNRNGNIIYRKENEYLEIPFSAKGIHGKMEPETTDIMVYDLDTLLYLEYSFAPMPPLPPFIPPVGATKYYTLKINSYIIDTPFEYSLIASSKHDAINRVSKKIIEDGYLIGRYSDDGPFKLLKFSGLSEIDFTIEEILVED